MDAQNMKPPQSSGTVALSSRRTGALSTSAPTTAVAAHTASVLSTASAGFTQRVRTYAPPVPARVKLANPAHVFSGLYGSAGPPSASPATLANPSPSAMIAQTPATTYMLWR